MGATAGVKPFWPLVRYRARGDGKRTVNFTRLLFSALKSNIGQDKVDPGSGFNDFLSEHQFQLSHSWNLSIGDDEGQMRRQLLLGGSMSFTKSIVFLLSLSSSIAFADSYACIVYDLGTGKELANFALVPPNQNKWTMNLPGDRTKMEVWTYHTSVGVIFTNLQNSQQELSSQMDFSSSGLFHIHFAGVMLDCQSDQ